ncbi:MAG: phage tail protein [Synergistaceae bacterium]|nr:phage tail protein [Synergistaceae bacterium]
MSEGMRITNAGRNALAQALTGKELKFTRVFVGDGVLTNQNIITLTNLISRKKELPIVNINKTDSIGTAEIVCEVNNSGLTQGFWVREFGLFAKDPATGQEILYAYRNVGNESSYIPADGGPDVVNYTLSLVTVIDQAQNVTAVIQGNNQYVTNTALISKINALFGEKRNIKGFWTYSENGEKIFRPVDLSDVKDSILGNYDADTINARVRVLEDALAQILVSLEVENLYPDYSHFIAEDFNDTSELDLYTCRVTSVIAGDDSIDCEPLDGMIPGSFYMLTDGINQELVQVDSISIENNIQRVILTQPVKNTYILNACTLYRTSANILTGQALGASARKYKSWPANISFSGSAASAVSEIALKTDINNSGNFEITGQGGFNASGQAAIII